MRRRYNNKKSSKYYEENLCPKCGGYVFDDFENDKRVCLDCESKSNSTIGKIKEIAVDWIIKLIIILIVIGGMIYIFMSRTWVRQDCSSQCLNSGEYKSCFRGCLDEKRDDDFQGRYIDAR